jgi:hypothetical protein
MSILRDRAKYVEGFDALNPNSLVGSFFHVIEDGMIVWQGEVVAEPGPSTYLVQIEQEEPGVRNAQRLFPIDVMCRDSDDKPKWRFFDTIEHARAAYAEWLSARIESTS